MSRKQKPVSSQQEVRKQESIMYPLKKIIPLLLIIVATVSHAQDVTYSAPDFDEIEKSVRDFDSQYYYPRLMNRYLQGDTAFTDKELTYLYYGYTYQEDYDPYRDIKYHTVDIDDLYNKESHTAAECDTIIKYAQLVLDDFPFEFRQMNMLAYAYAQKGDTQTSAFWNNRMRRLLNVILHTGDGIKPETAWYVISSVHEYDIIYCLGLLPTGYTFVEPMYDFIDIKPVAGKKEEGYYFNVSRMLSEYYRKQ